MTGKRESTPRRRRCRTARWAMDGIEGWPGGGLLSRAEWLTRQLLNELMDRAEARAKTSWRGGAARVLGATLERIVASAMNVRSETMPKMTVGSSRDGQEQKVETTPEMTESGAAEIVHYNYLDDDPRDWVVLVPRNAFIKAVRDELIDHFQGTSVQGLVELEAESIARYAHARLRDDLATKQNAG